MDSQIISTLEFDKLMQILSGFAISTPGKENLLALEPDFDTRKILHSLNEITEMRSLKQNDDPFPLSQIPDLRTTFTKLKIHGTALLPGELLLFHQALSVSGQISQYLEKRKDKYPLLFLITENMTSHRDAINSIDNAIAETGLIKDTASPKLKQIRREIVSLIQDTNEKLNQILKNNRSFIQEQVITFREGRMVIPVRTEFKNRISGFIHDQSASGATVFIEPIEIFKMNNRIRELQTGEKNEIDRILRNLTKILQSQYPEIWFNYECLIRLDEIQAKSRLADLLKANSPKLSNNNQYSLINAQHPLLVTKSLAESAQSGKNSNVIPLTIEFNDSVHTIVITGPNAGGKTVALKTVGLCALMFQTGLHVPCADYSEFIIFRNVYVDIGDLQSIENDLSTFSSHISRLKEIEENARFRDLVLLDEIGTGTDPAEGSALAIALLDQLNKRNVFTLATTHYGALKAFAHNTPGVENASMEFNTESLTPTYRLQVGHPGNSYAFDIAQRLGISASLLERARNELTQEEVRLDHLLLDLQQKLKEAENRTFEVAVKQTELDNLLSTYRERNQRWKEFEDKQRRLLNEQIQGMKKDFNIKFEKLVREIRETNASREKIREAKKFIGELIPEEPPEYLKNKKELTAESKDSEELQLGDFVDIPGRALRGEIVELPDHQGNVVVGIGSVRFKIPKHEVHKISEFKRDEARVQIHYPNLSETKSEIDLRGLNSDEAIDQVDKYLDDAYITGWKEVTLIHGKGNGILQKALNRFLKSHPRVASKRSGRWGEGDLGVTIVELK